MGSPGLVTAVSALPNSSGRSGDLLVLFLRVVVVVQAHADDLSGTRDRREQSGVVGRNRRVGGGLDGVFD